jgi:translation initiation factor 5
MPSPVLKVEGRGNGIKTVLMNLKDIGDSLHRHPDELLQYISKTLGTQLIKEETRFIINGSHSEDKINNSIDKYIDKFVLCGKCYKPDTRYSIESKQLFLKCSGCGEKKIISHDFTRTIMKNESYLLFSKQMAL